MKLHGTPFENSKTCKGISFAVKGLAVDMSLIEISGRYPESGWAVNREVCEIAYVQGGEGSLQLDESEIGLKEGDAVAVQPGQKFFWSGNMTLVMACSPPFDPDQYTVELIHARDEK